MSHHHQYPKEDQDTFSSVTGISDSSLISRYLEMGNGNVQDAIALFFENPPEQDSDHIGTEETTPTATETRIDRSGFGSVQYPQHSPQIQPSTHTASSTSSRTGRGPSRGAGSGRMMTLRDLGGGDGGSGDDETDEKNRFFAGGSQGSGQQIIGTDPRSGGPPVDADDFLRRAREQGAVDREKFVREEEDKKRFQGRGHRLGSQPSSTHEIQEAPTPILKQRTERSVTINFWHDGFSIDDGELRRFDDPANREFLESINRGLVPSEFNSTEDEDIVFDLVKKESNYTPPVQTFKAFAGQGKTLTGSSSGGASSSAQPVKKLESYECDTSRPHTSLQIRLADSTRIVAKFNLDDTIDTVRGFVAALTQHPNPIFDLQTTFPKKVLSDYSQTIEQAGLKNASLIQVMRN